MITTSAPPRRSRIFEIALGLSILMHLLVLLVYLGVGVRLIKSLQPLPPKEQFTAVSDVIRLEKRNVPRPAVRQPPVAPPPPAPPLRVSPPRPRVVVQPRPTRPRVERREIARITKTAPPQVAYTTPAPAAPVQPQQPTSAQQRSSAPSMFSPQSQAAMQQAFQQAISQSRTAMANIPPQHQAPSATTPRNLLMVGSPEELTRAQGYILRVDPCEAHPHCYFLRVEIIWPDNYTETVDMPWPFTYPANADPIPYMTRRTRISQQPPPSGFVLQPGFQLSRIVCIFFRDRCQAIFDEEARNGGHPATN